MVGSANAESSKHGSHQDCIDELFGGWYPTLNYRNAIDYAPFVQQRSVFEFRRVVPQYVTDSVSTFTYTQWPFRVHLL